MSTLLKIFIVEDDPYYARLIQHHFGTVADYYTEIFFSGAELMRNIHRQPDIITLDFGLPDYDGVNLLKKIKEFNSEIPVVVVSGQNELNNAVNLFNAGAFDYVIKNSEAMDRLFHIVERLKEQLLMKRELKSLKRMVNNGFDSSQMNKKNKEVEKSMSFVETASASDNPVLIEGEEGSGRVFLAKSIHYNSYRSNEPFVEYSPRIENDENIEIELFGYEKDSMPGVQVRKNGKIGEANKGTLFIEEISNLDLESQKKILKVIQEQKFIRMGSHRVVNTDVRIIASTKINLLQKVEKKEFNNELYYSLSSFSIQLLPLRNRMEDVVILSEYFVKQYCESVNIPIKKISKNAQKKLLEYSYPGNISELKSIINRAMSNCSSNIIIPENIFLNNNSENIFSWDKEFTMEQYNEMIIKYYLKKYQNNVGIVSKKLDMSKSTIYRLLKNEKENSQA